MSPPADDSDTLEAPVRASHQADGTVKRRPFRRDQILQAAVRLFNERGYHETGMNDIGAAVGITGPGIYRHFKNKQAILETALLEAGERMTERVHEITTTSASPRETLERLVDNYIETLLDYPALSTMVMAERRVLSETTRLWVARHLRLHVEEWVNALLHVRNDLSELEARVLVLGAFGMSHSLDRFANDLDRERLGALLKSMAMATLFAEKPRSGASGRRRKAAGSA